jgi:hypothetical protein
MDAIRDIFTPPTAQQQVLLWLLLGVSLVIHLAFMGMLMGGTILSIIFRLLHRATKNPMHERFARDVIDTFAANKGVGILLGIVPLITIGLIYTQMYSMATTVLVYFWLASIALVIVALGHIYFYQDNFPKRDRGFFLHLGAGAAGVGALKAAYLVFFFGLTLLIDPEKWYFLDPTRPFSSVYWISLSWNHIIRFTHFMIMAFALTGVGVIFFFNHWPGKTKEKADPEYQGFVKKIGVALALPMISMQPIIWFLDIWTMPPAAVSVWLMILTIPALVLAAIVCHLLYSTLRHGGSWQGAAAFVLFLCVFGIMVATEQRAAANATREYLALASFNAEKDLKEMEEEAMRTWRKPPENYGELIFMERCTACHSLDPGTRKIGPSLFGLLGREVELDSGKKFARDADYIRNSIADPDGDVVAGFTPGVMSGTIRAGSMTKGKLDALVKFLTGPKTGNEAPSEEEKTEGDGKETDEKK